MFEFLNIRETKISYNMAASETCNGAEACEKNGPDADAPRQKHIERSTTSILEEVFRRLDVDKRGYLGSDELGDFAFATGFEADMEDRLWDDMYQEISDGLDLPPEGMDFEQFHRFAKPFIVEGEDFLSLFEDSPLSSYDDGRPEESMGTMSGSTKASCSSRYPYEGKDRRDASSCDASCGLNPGMTSCELTMGTMGVMKMNISEMGINHPDFGNRGEDYEIDSSASDKDRTRAPSVESIASGKEVMGASGFEALTRTSTTGEVSPSRFSESRQIDYEGADIRHHALNPAAMEFKPNFPHSSFAHLPLSRAYGSNAQYERALTCAWRRGGFSALYAEGFVADPQYEHFNGYDPRRAIVPEVSRAPLGVQGKKENGGCNKELLALNFSGNINLIRF